MWDFSRQESACPHLGQRPSPGRPAFNRSTAAVRLDMLGRTDLFAERSINAQGFKTGLDGEYLVDSVEQVFTQSGWTTTVECNGGKQGKAKAKGKKTKAKAPLQVIEL